MDQATLRPLTATRLPHWKLAPGRARQAPLAPRRGGAGRRLGDVQHVINEVFHER
ncbi:hypothetical protein H8N00_10740 [Streptomyces sp. AC563]|uniref:hypothetical protein n=1 Tax=Streptomyces buecherae TaxID=2763006 RepID=UPI00164ED6CB|nr:hypothetical protein [Streptomyces buecherae]MBC3989349.1 hypothetical protein [Streptomyces buecherae]